MEGMPYKRTKIEKEKKRETEIHRSRMRILLRMQKKEKEHVESEKLRTTERNSYSNILYGNGITRTI